MLLSTVVLSILSGCGVYSFTGASISPETKSISIPIFYNNAALGPATMSAVFTEKIRDYYQTNTSLLVKEENGDLHLEGVISDYTVTPASANSASSSDGVDYSSRTRVTIRVKASYTNVNDDTFDFENKVFDFFIDFDQDTQDLASNEEQFMEEIFDRIIFDIFNATVANW